MDKGRGGMGIAKHRKSGTVPKGRHGLRMTALSLNREAESAKQQKEKRKENTYQSIKELMKVSR